MNSWEGKFGDEYIDRNPMDAYDLDKLYEKRYGITRTEMNERFIGSMYRWIRILEVGCGAGAQLDCLKKMGFNNVSGADINKKAHEISLCDLHNDFYLANAEDMSCFPDGVFKLVFTSGLLIHIPPDKLGQVMSEIHRVSNKYIWGFEYHSDSTTPIMIPYRGMDNMLWKANYPMLYWLAFKDLVLVDFQRYPQKDNPNNVDVMFLLKKVEVGDWEKEGRVRDETGNS